MDIDYIEKMWRDLMNMNNIINHGYMIPSHVQEKRTDLDYELIEDDKSARFVFEVAGMEKEEISVETIDDLLVVKGDNQRKAFEYRIPIKTPLVEPKATYKNGILEVIFKKVLKQSVKVKIE